MRIRITILSLITIWFFTVGVLMAEDKSGVSRKGLPDGFVYVANQMPAIFLDVRYYSTDNFVGKRVSGYINPVCITTIEAATALMEVEHELVLNNYQLKILKVRKSKTRNFFLNFV